MKKAAAVANAANNNTSLLKESLMISGDKVYLKLIVRNASGFWHYPHVTF
jgi:hypothetical protein